MEDLTATQEYTQEAKRTLNIETQRRVTMESHDLWTVRVAQLEAVLGIDKRWTPADQQYQDAEKFIDMKDYHEALEKLQRLVVLRLFELQKLNLAQTGKNSYIP